MAIDTTQTYFILVFVGDINYIFSWFQSAVLIKNHLWQRLSQDWTLSGRDWVDVEIVQHHGSSIEFRLRFLDEDGDDSNVFSPPDSAMILRDITRYLRSFRAFPHQIYVEDLGGGRRAYRVGVGLEDEPHEAYDSGCEI